MALEAAASPTLAGPSRVPAQQDSPEQPFAPSYYECAICNEILLDPVVGEQSAPCTSPHRSLNASLYSAQ